MNTEFPGSQAGNGQAGYPHVFEHASETRLRYFLLGADGLKETVTPAGTTNQAYIPSLDWTKTRNEEPDFHLLTATGDGIRSRPLSLTKEDFSRLCAEWHLPPKLLRKCSRHTQSFLEFSIQEQEVDAEDNTLSRDMSLPVPKLLSIVFRVTDSRPGTVCILSCDLRARASSRCFIASENDLATAAYLAEIHAHAGDVLFSPEAVLGLILSDFSRDLDNDLEYAGYHSRQLAPRLGILSPALRDIHNTYGSTYAPDHDYTSLNVDMYDCEWRLNAIQAVKDRIVLHALALLAIFEEYTDKSRSPAAFECVNDTIRWSELCQTDLDFERINIKNQRAVLFNLINQRDSRLNYSVARSSRQIAAASKRDSSAMKTISILTLVFLPGTFVSAIFSTQIFNFSDPDAGYGRVGKAWWIYMLCCLLLTLVTVGIWATWTVWRLNKAAEEERKEMGELERDDSESQRRNTSPSHEPDLAVAGAPAWSTRRSVDATRDRQRRITRESSHRHSVASISNWSESGRSQRSSASASGRNGSRSSVLGAEEMQHHEKSPGMDQHHPYAPDGGHGQPRPSSFRGSAPSLTMGRGLVEPASIDTATDISRFSPLTTEENAAHDLAGSHSCAASTRHQSNGDEEAVM